MPTKSCNDIDFHNSTVAWFVALEKAREDHDFERAAEAKRQLERLGVIVKYRRKRRVD
jgi:hypothetical protein